MEKHPNRSWAHTHMQLWSLTMKDHVYTRSNSVYDSAGRKKSLKERSCWRYNKGKCTCGEDCKFEHRCSSCGSFNHIFLKCPRKGKKQEAESKTKNKRKEAKPADSDSNN